MKGANRETNIEFYNSVVLDFMTLGNLGVAIFCRRF